MTLTKSHHQVFKLSEYLLRKRCFIRHWPDSLPFSPRTTPVPKPIKWRGCLRVAATVGCIYKVMGLGYRKLLSQTLYNLLYVKPNPYFYTAAPPYRGTLW